MKKLVLLSFLLGGCSIVGPGQRGVRISLGTVSEEPKMPGAYLWIPFILGMSKIDVQIQNEVVESTGATKDMQDVHASLAVNYSITPNKVVKTYKDIGDEKDVFNRIISPSVNEVMKASISKRTAEEVLTKRMDMKLDIDNGLKDRLEKNGVTLHDVSIVNLNFSRGFTDAIEKKQIAEQEAKQAFYGAQKATQDANAAIEKAKGEAASQNLIRASITKEILQQRAIEKWDGRFPQVMGAQALPFIDLKSLKE
ncbi:MAG TPA: prohibitin family protein [Candidatus Paceibacterota bacterium]|nr:prohibitin family protein [Candidatus Paceibacterota bacterium]